VRQNRLHAGREWKQEARSRKKELQSRLLLVASYFWLHAGFRFLPIQGGSLK
jgi:hypothetical protein